MFSSLETVIGWAARRFGMPAATYPQAGSDLPFAVVNRVSGACEYPHDYPRYAVQFWTESDAQGESLAFACARASQELLDESERINAVGTPEITQLGLIDGGGFVWQVAFDLATNIYEN